MTYLPLHDDAMRIPVLGGALLVAFALLTTAVATIGGIGVAHDQPVVVSDSKDLMVDNGPGGSLVITELAPPSKVHVIRASNGEGFVGVAVQGLNYARATAGIDPQAPFRLLRDTNGRFWLEDLVTHKRLALDAFGPGNARVFAQFFSDGKAQP